MEFEISCVRCGRRATMWRAAGGRVWRDPVCGAACAHLVAEATAADRRRQRIARQLRRQLGVYIRPQRGSDGPGRTE